MSRSFDTFVIVAFMVILFVGIIDNLPTIRKIFTLIAGQF
jgi:hypothetical protein